MTLERTLSIIKPDGVKRGVIGNILNRFETAGLKIAATKMLHLSIKEAEGFYAVHSDKPFFEELTVFMSSGPVVVTVLKGITPSQKTEKSWAQPIQKMRIRERFERISPTQLVKIRFMVQMLRKQLLLKLPTSFPKQNW